MARLQTAMRFMHKSTPCAAGHNKWSKIHRKKAIADRLRSQMIQKYVSRITTAIRTGGGPDPEMNVRLASLIQQAKSDGVTKVNIETAIRQASSKQAGGELFMYEAMSEAGYMLVIEVMTDNNNRTRPIIKNFLVKHGCQIGSTLFNFDHKGIVRVPCHELQGRNVDPMDLAIEVGAEDVTADSDDPETGGSDLPATAESSPDHDPDPDQTDSDICFQFKCEPRDLKSISDAIRGQSFSISSASLEYIPKTLVALERGRYEKAVRLSQLLLEQDDVIEVYDNFTLERENS